MRIMPIVLASSVDVVSTERAHRMHRRTSTETTGAEATLCRWLEEEASDSEEAEEKEESQCRADGLEGISVDLRVNFPVESY
jgi:hypothetical protein